MTFNVPNTVDNIADNEELRRYFFQIHYDSEFGEWSYNTFQLRDLNPPENYLSVTRVKISPDARVYAIKCFSTNKLKKIMGYTTLIAKDIREIDIKNITLKVLSDAASIDGHAGIYTWHDSELVEGSVEFPEILELKKTLFDLAIPTYKSM